MRNMQAHLAHQAARSGQVRGPLSSDLREKYGRRSVRVVEGDTVTVSRGEYRNMAAKVAGVDVGSGTVTLEGLQGEKQRGDKFSVKIHASNLRVTGINGRDKKRMKGLTGTESALPGHDRDEAPRAPGPEAPPPYELPEPRAARAQVFRPGLAAELMSSEQAESEPPASESDAAERAEQPASDPAERSEPPASESEPAEQPASDPAERSEPPASESEPAEQPASDPAERSEPPASEPAERAEQPASEADSGQAGKEEGAR